MSTMVELSAGADRSASEIRVWIVAELARSLNVRADTIDTAAPLETLGVDSLAALGMTGGLAGFLNRDLPATLLWDYRTIDELAAALATREDSARALARPGVVDLQPLGNAAPLFCFPGMRGHPVTFAPLASALGPHQPCYGLIVPGLNGERPPLTTVSEIAAAMVNNLRLVQPRGPYQLAGYSFGGLLAFEAAQQLVASGERVALLAIYDTFAPGGRVKRPRWQQLAIRAYGRVHPASRQDSTLSRATAPGRNDRDDAQFSDQTGIDRTVIAAVRTANWHASMSYTPGVYPGQLVLFRATERSPYTQFYKLDACNGWSSFARDVRVIPVAGSHYRLLDSQYAVAAAQSLARCLIGAAAADAA